MQIRFFGYRTPIFVNGAFVALGVYDFSFPSYGHFREETRPTGPKVFPYPTVVDSIAVSVFVDFLITIRNKFKTNLMVRRAGLSNQGYLGPIKIAKIIFVWRISRHMWFPGKQWVRKPNSLSPGIMPPNCWAHDTSKHVWLFQFADFLFFGKSLRKV